MTELRGARSRRALLAGAAFAGATALTFWRALFLGETFTDRDLSVFWRPARAVLARLLTEAPSFPPAWNPYFAEGQPFSANPHHALFHPLTLLFGVLPFEWAFRLQILLPPLLTACGMYLLLRTLRRSPIAATFGGLAWGFGGAFLSSTNLIPILFTLAPLPFTLVFVVRAVRNPGLPPALGVAFCFGLQCLGGEAASLAISLLLVVAAATAEAFDRRATSLKGSLGTLALGVVLGGICGTASLVPGLLHARKTLRIAGLSDQLASVAAFPPARLGELVFPFVLGHVERAETPAFWGAPFYKNEGFPLIFGIYGGLAVPVLAAPLLWTRRRPRKEAGGALLSSLSGKQEGGVGAEAPGLAGLLLSLAKARHLPWLLASAAGWVLALGPALPIWPALRLLPVVSGVRYPEKFAILGVFPLVVLASAGLDALRMSGCVRLWGLWLACGVTAAASLGSIAMAVSSLASAPAAPYLRRDLLAMAVAGLLLTGILVQKRFDRRFLLVGLTAVELVLQGNRLVGTRPVAEAWKAPAFLAPAIERLREAPLFHLSALLRQPPLPPPALAATPIPAQWGIPLALEEDFDLTQLRWSTEASIEIWRIATTEPRLLAPVLARRGIGAVIAPRTRPDGSVVPGIVMPSARRPISFFAERVEIAADPAAWHGVMRRLGPAAAATVCLMRDPDRVPPEVPAPSTGSVSILERLPGVLRFEVDVTGPSRGVLAVNQTWDEGWRAEIDGVPASIDRADISLIALAVPPGKHSVRLRYEAPAVVWSWRLSFVAFLVCGAGLAAATRKGTR